MALLYLPTIVIYARFLILNQTLGVPLDKAKVIVFGPQTGCVGGGVGVVGGGGDRC